jgi:hypothetical protein
MESAAEVEDTWTGSRGMIPAAQPSEKTARGNHYPLVTDLERSHNEMRAGLIIAVREIRPAEFRTTQ